MNKKVNLEEYKEFNKEFDSYEELIKYYKQFPEKYYKERNFYFEKHHIIPISEDKASEEIVCLDLAHHAMAHFLRAKEYEKIGNKNIAYKNYHAAQKILGAFVNRKEEKIPKEIIKHAEEIKQKSGESTGDQFRECIYVTDGVNTKRLKKEKVENFLSLHPNFKIGGVFSTAKGNIWIYKDNERLNLPKEEALKYIENNQGWKTGMGPTSKHIPKLGYFKGTTNGKKWVHKGEERKNIEISEIPSYLENGWALGSGNSNTNLGKKTIHKGDEMKNVPMEKLSCYLSQGWEIGRSEKYKQGLRKPKNKRKIKNENSQT